MRVGGGDAPITLVPNCRSNPSFVVCSIGGNINPPLLKRTSSRLSLLKHDKVTHETICGRYKTRFSCAPDEFCGGALDGLQVCKVQLQGQRLLTRLLAQIFDGSRDSLRVAPRNVHLRVVAQEGLRAATEHISL